jgi:5-methyltetrahydrofolate--homocysteine methyltransferase
MISVAAWHSILSSRFVHLMDGGMGSELMKAGLPISSDSAGSWNLSHPERVQTIHERYLQAGAESLVTNTFDLAGRSIDQSTLRAQYRAGLAIANSAVGKRTWIFASFSAPPDPEHSPTASADPYGSFQDDPAKYLEQMCWLKEDIEGLRSADAILLETQIRLAYPRRLLDEIKQTRTDLSLIVSFAYPKLENGGWLGGSEKAELAARWAEENRDHIVAIGVNCGNHSLDDVLDIVRRYRRETSLPILARPSAGDPKTEGDSLVFPYGPEMMAERVQELLEAGVTLLGGCCGTTPEHIAAFKPIVDAWNSVNCLAP